jgi:signal transduction histidine kinase
MYDNEKYRKTFKEGVERELSNVNRFLDDLTRLTKPASLAIISLDAQKVIEGVLKSYEGEASRKGLGLVREFAAQGTRISADRFAFERVINNLMRNAIEAVLAPEGTVKTGTRRDGAFLQIFISDTGCGIPREKLKDIFEDYRTTKRRGLGLGLAICKKLTEEMRGSIRIESEEGKGTVAHLRFPAA